MSVAKVIIFGKLCQGTYVEYCQRCSLLQSMICNINVLPWSVAGLFWNQKYSPFSIAGNSPGISFFFQIEIPIVEAFAKSSTQRDVINPNIQGCEQNKQSNYACVNTLELFVMDSSFNQTQN